MPVAQIERPVSTDLGIDTREDPRCMIECEGSKKSERKHSGSANGKEGTKKNKASIELGRRGEEAAAKFLDKRGYTILERNWKCFAGEADIIAQDGDSIVFVEVKTRRDCKKGFPAEAVNKEKRQKYEKIALAYLQDCAVSDAMVRFDVVSIVVVASDRALIRHHINAFAAA